MSSYLICKDLSILPTALHFIKMQNPLHKSENYGEGLCINLLAWDGELTAKPKRTLPDSNPYSIIEVYEPRQG